mmetsp:Transcript_34327/g.85549  ORF Transcript_34327/g.85549 Transcript_34327/m.85549 type:complete len:288 (-) Transcript_34327:123-986(-)
MTSLRSETPMVAITMDAITVTKPELWNGDVVVLWGWYGAVDKHLAKYSLLHNSQGRATVRVTAPTNAVMLKRKSTLAAVARQSLSLGDALRAEGGGVMIAHMFSNGGCFLYECWLDAQAPDAKDGPMARLDGVIFDSCPAYMHPELGARVIREHTNSGLNVFLYQVISGAWVTWTRCTTRPGQRPPELYWDLLGNDASKVAALYLFSRDDTITDTVALEQLIATRRAKGGTQIEAIQFDKSGHVQHLRTNPEAYEAAVHKFVEQAAKSVRAQAGGGLSVRRSGGVCA